jgi:TolB-like protein/Tfp pilus assembly protein PilF
MGTPNYMSPEQARGLKVDVRSDLFSLGVMLYEMIAGRAPFVGETPTDVIISIVQQEPAPLAHYAPEAPRELGRIVAKALRKDREERYQTATEMLADLKGLRLRLELQDVSEGAGDAAAPGIQAKGAKGGAKDAKGGAKGAKGGQGMLTARRAWRWAMAAGLIVLPVAGWLWLARTAVKPESPVIAVLPFKNLSDDKEGDYFTDGLTDELIRNLSIIEGLEVRSRTSSFAFKDKPYNVREVGEKLNVNYVLDGTVLRSGGNLRINAEFIRVSDDKPLWKDKFDRELKDIFKIQDEISLGIVNQLRLNLGRGRRRYETSVEAYDLYLRAGNQLPPPGASFVHIAEQARLYEEVIAKDPSFAPAYARLALAHAGASAAFPIDNPADWLPGMRAAAEKAIQLDPLLPEAHVALARMHARDGQWIQSENSFREAIRLNQNNAETYTEYAVWLLQTVGRVEDAIEQLRRAEKTDPLSEDVKRYMGIHLIAIGRIDEAAAYLEQLRSDPAGIVSILWARIRLVQGRTAEAIQLLENNPDRSVNPLVRGWLGYAYARSGRREEAEKMAAISQYANEQALIFAGLGAKDRAFEALERMGSRGPQRVGRFLTYPEFAFLRGDPRLAALRKKAGLPDQK